MRGPSSVRGWLWFWATFVGAGIALFVVLTVFRVGQPPRVSDGDFPRAAEAEIVLSHESRMEICCGLVRQVVLRAPADHEAGDLFDRQVELLRAEGWKVKPEKGRGEGVRSASAEAPDDGPWMHFRAFDAGDSDPDFLDWFGPSWSPRINQLAGSGRWDVLLMTLTPFQKASYSGG